MENRRIQLYSIYINSYWKIPINLSFAIVTNQICPKDREIAEFKIPLCSPPIMQIRPTTHIPRSSIIFLLNKICFVYFCFSFRRYGPVCPQRLPDISNETAALERMPKGRLEYLRRMFPYLQNQSEDCLYLNIYAPVQGKWFECMAGVGGECYCERLEVSWNTEYYISYIT